MMPKFKKALAAAVLLTLGSGANAVITNFSKDVGASIDRGLAWQDANGAYTGSAGDATGLSLLALLEKRVDGTDPNSVSQGYALASAADKARMDLAVDYILTHHVVDCGGGGGGGGDAAAGGLGVADVPCFPVGFYAYRDGADMMALSVYLLTAGPNPGVKDGINTIFDRAIAAQRVGMADDPAPWPENNGYWCYTDNGCRDSSTTQFVMAGLASVKSVYSNATYADAARLAQLNAATALARTAYQRNGIPGYNGDSGACNFETADEKGHGYNAGSINTLQQTGSGTWIQLVGGATVNDPDVQGYLKWIRNRYNYEGQRWEPHDGWPSYWYYLWSTSKAFEFIAASGVPVAAGNIGPSDIGLLPAASAPACDYRELHRVPSTDARVPSFGGNPAPYYGAETPRVYYDAAYTVLSYQCPPGDPSEGFYGCNGAPGGWGYNFDSQAYAILMLQRSVGGGCLDSDGDGICDSIDNCPAVANPLQEDTDGDGKGDACDNCPTVANPGQENTYGDARGDACEPRPIVKCDVDGDGDIDQNDLSLISRARGKLSPPVPASYDANNDGKIDARDVLACIKLCTRPNCATQ